MANLNLSEFTEKLFVADADHTFIWDTAASISKRVSRNSWLSAGSIATSTPLTISQTWNAGTNVMTALKVVATDTASGAASNLLELWAGSTPALKLKVDKAGIITANRVVLDQSGSTYQLPANTPIFWTGVSFLRSPSAGVFSFENNTQANFFLLAAEAANTLALRNGANAQTFNVYGTSSASNANYARLALTCGLDGNATISTQALGTGTAGVLALSPGGSERMRITTAGNVGIGTTAPTAPLEIRATAATGIRESLLKCTVSDAGNDAFHIYNATSADNRFSPGFSGSMFSSNVGSVIFTGQTDSTNDTGNSPLTVFSGRITSSQTDPNNGTLSAVTTRPLFAWWNLSTPVMQLNANGNLGIGTTSPTSKLQVTGGDVEIETVTSGIIMKAAGTSTRYRITLNATGDALVFTAI